MELVRSFIELFLHLDEYLNLIISQYGTWTYALLFLIIFMETGFVVTPFLPGDSLLFAAGSFAALGSLNPVILFVLLAFSAVLGDTVNYWIGHYIGPRAFSGNIRFLKKEYLDKTHAFYEKHGGKTIILARFIPIIRTFAPFVAGVGAMTYWKFITYNVVGGITWVAIFTFGGYFFGNLDFVRRNFEIVIFAIIAISLMPPVIELIKAKLEQRRQKKEVEVEI
ncbi:MAG: DedA family protein [Gammaproteobacteria bacterium]|nr:DedA family protein [Gammaproteobacteria bacterium]